MINEVVQHKPSEDFYGEHNSNYIKTVIDILQSVGAEVNSIDDILKIGIYITNAVKTPKKEYTIDKSSIKNSLPYLEEEISLFKNIKDGKYDALYYAIEYGKNEEIIKLLTR